MWVTGMTGQTADNKDDVGAQAQVALERMFRVLKAGGFTPDDIVEVNCYLRNAKDVENFRKMNEGYRRVFQKNLPARTTLQGPARSTALVEITIMAAR
jgi:enamine deaminase RidA (YjgF/YER057c/UK114 family)